MSLSFFLKQFLFHTTAAAIVLFVVLLLGEFFVPGSVLPFINLIDASLFLMVLVIFTGIVVSKE